MSRCVDSSRLVIHRIAPWSLLQKRATDAVNTHLRRIYDSDTLLEGLSTCFMTGTIRGDISFFLCVTLITVKTPHFSLRRCWLMLEPSRCKISAEFKVGCITGLDECLNPENDCMLNIYGRCTSHQLVFC